MKIKIVQGALALRRRVLAADLAHEHVQGELNKFYLIFGWI